MKKILLILSLFLFSYKNEKQDKIIEDYVSIPNLTKIICYDIDKDELNEISNYNLQPHISKNSNGDLIIAGWKFDGTSAKLYLEKYNTNIVHLSLR